MKFRGWFFHEWIVSGDAFCTRVNGNGFNNYFYNVSEYTATLGLSRLAGLQLPFHTTP